ncbi:MAG: hypothetical protein K2X66_09280, partial [Cyanobacteria bacterium]|nr:hypothetical protein [Cyanobacteriota bacterium]
LAHYYLSEITRLTSLSEIKPENVDAEKIRRWVLGSWTEDHISMSDLIQRVPIRRLRMKERMEPVVAILIEAGFLIETPEPVIVGGKTRKGAFRIVRK